MVALQVISNAGIALAYLSIPIVLWSFIRKRRDVPFSGTIAMFGLFIVACGLTHVMGILTIWYPAYWLDGAIKGVTAIASLATAVLLWPLLPKALTLKTPAALEQLNARLEQDLRVRENALAESERQYQSLAEALPQIVWTANADGLLDYYNQRWFDYTGMTMEESRGWGWQPVLHPDDIRNCLERWMHSIQSGTPYEVEHRFRRASDGTYRWHLGRALPVRDAAGYVVKWFGTCTDIDDQKRASEAAGRLTEQLRINDILEGDIRARKSAEEALLASEERFRQVEEHAPIGLALVALDGRFIRVNPALCALTGYSKKELLSQTFQVLTHPEDLEADLAYIRETLNGTIATYEMEKRYFHKDGHSVWTQLNVSLVRDDAGEADYFIAQIQDISFRKAAERELRFAQASAFAAMEAKSRFLATMSHEIRTPMNGIIGMAELLSLSELTVEQSEYVKIVGDSGRSLLRVLNDVLDYSKIEAGMLELEAVDFDLLSQIESVVSLFRPELTTTSVSLTTHVEPDVPVRLKGDPSRLRQILINLLGNALKFTPPDGNIQMFVAAEPEEGDVVQVRFTIKDTGVGIAPDFRERLFQPFSQLDSSTTRKYGGTGLGLSICKQLVDLMGGHIGVESELHRGSSFWFTIPFLRGHRAQRVRDAGVNGERRVAAARRPEKLLLAEDNQVNVLLAVRQFKRLGFDVTVVPNGREAVDAVQREPYDIIFMDCHMPGMDGWDATREIRKLAPSHDRRRIPIVAMTADALEQDQQLCLAAGMDDYISKPATLSDLRTVLARWLPGYLKA